MWESKILGKLMVILALHEMHYTYRLLQCRYDDLVVLGYGAALLVPLKVGEPLCFKMLSTILGAMSQKN